MPRGRPANPVNQKIKLDRERRTLLRNLRDLGYSKGYAEGMNVHQLANWFGKEPALVHQRIKVLKEANPSIETKRKNVLLQNKILGIKKPRVVSSATLEKRAISEGAKKAKAAQRAKNKEGVAKRNALLAKRYSQGAIGADLINGMGIGLVEAINIARKAAEENPLLEYKRAQALKRLREGGVYSTMSISKALSWIREDLVTFGEGIAKREHKVGRSVSEIRAEIGIKGKENMRKEVNPATFMQKNNFKPKTFEFLSNTFLASFDLNSRRPKNAFEVAGVLRTKVPSLPENMIQSYSNWVFTFLQTKENEAKFVEFLKQLK